MLVRIHRWTAAALIVSATCAMAATHVLTASPASINFGSQTVRTTVSQPLTISNSGSASVQVQTVTVNGSSAFRVSGFSAAVTLKPGQSLPLTVSFTPAAAGNYSGSVAITGTRGVNLSVPLSGSGIGVAVSVSPTSATVQTGGTQQFTATVTGTTNTAVNWLVNTVAGGDSSVGTISATGLYTAPAAVPSAATVTVTAQSVVDTAQAASASVTISAGQTTYSNLDDSTVLDTGGSSYGWGWCGSTGCAGGGSTATQNMYWGQQPSLDGGSAEFQITGSSWADGLWWHKVGPNDAVTNFQEDFWINVGQQVPTYAQALEFDTFQFVSPTRYMFGTQCNYSSGYSNGTWDVWNEGAQSWSHTSFPCPSFVPGDWYRVTWNFNRTSDGKEHYNSVAVQHYDSTGTVLLDSSNTNVAITMSSGPLPSGWSNTMGVQFQLDINSAPGSGTVAYTVFVEKVNLTVW